MKLEPAAGCVRGDEVLGFQTGGSSQQLDPSLPGEMCEAVSASRGFGSGC